MTAGEAMAASLREKQLQGRHRSMEAFVGEGTRGLFGGLEQAQKLGGCPTELETRE